MKYIMIKKSFHVIERSIKSILYIFIFFKFKNFTKKFIWFKTLMKTIRNHSNYVSELFGVDKSPYFKCSKFELNVLDIELQKAFRIALSFY